MQLSRNESSGIDPKVIDHIKTSQDWNQYFPTIRKGNTGVGMTLEHLCDIPENNIKGPDLFDAEMKAKRLDSDCLLTLFTSNPYRAVRKLTTEYGTDAYDEYGNLSRRRLYHTVKNGHSDLFSLDDADDGMLLLNEGEVVAKWSEAQFTRALKKLTNLCLIDAKTRTTPDGSEEFKYTGFTYYHGFDPQAFYELLLDGGAYVDFRAHFCHVKKKMRDHGTAFRINPVRLASLYDGHQRVDLEKE